MSEATSGFFVSYRVPAYRCAHPGYLLTFFPEDGSRKHALDREQLAQLSPG
jgi:hypothetical protein